MLSTPTENTLLFDYFEKRCGLIGFLTLKFNGSAILLFPRRVNVDLCEGRGARARPCDHTGKITLKPTSPIQLTAIRQETNWLSHDLVSGSW
jgi:hypothetical protein